MGPEIIGAAAEKELTATLERVLGGPARELGAYLADKIRALRYNSLLKIVENAERRAREKNLLLKMPPLKFFVPFCESASLEEETDIESGSLSDLWTNLLLSACTTYDPRHLMFLRILKELTSNEAKFIDMLINSSRATIRFKPISWEGYEDAPYLNLHAIDAFLARLDRAVEPESLLDYLVNCLECPGVRFLDGAFYPLDEAGFPNYEEGDSIGVHNVDRPDTDIAMNVLEGLNLGQTIYVDDHRFRTYPEYIFSLTYFRLTELGVAFLDSCNIDLKDKKFEQVIDSDAP